MSIADSMKPGTIVAVGDMLAAAFPLQHEEMWTTDMEAEGGFDSRAYCRCGWIAPPVEFAAQVARFIDHLNDQMRDLESRSDDE
jgi:hypothetical protein